MKQKVTPPVIIGIVVVLALFMFGLYRMTLGKSRSVAATADSAPAYAKQMMQQQKSGNTGAPAPSGQASGYGQSYAEGAKHGSPYSRPGGSMGSAPQMGGGMGGSMGGASQMGGSMGGSMGGGR